MISEVELSVHIYNPRHLCMNLARSTKPLDHHTHSDEPMGGDDLIQCDQCSFELVVPRDSVSSRGYMPAKISERGRSYLGNFTL